MPEPRDGLEGEQGEVVGVHPMPLWYIVANRIIDVAFVCVALASVALTAEAIRQIISN